MPRPAIHSVIPATLACLALLVGCDDEPQIVTYEALLDPRPELLVEREQERARILAAEAPPDVMWNLPTGWGQEDHEGGDRLATLTAAPADTGGEALTVAVTRFRGAGGDLVANLRRWRGQIGIQASLKTEELTKFVREIEDAAIPGILIDMTGEQRLVTAWFTDSRWSWFIKVQDAPERVAPQIDAFQALVRSFRFVSDPDDHDHHDHDHHNHPPDE